MDPYWNPDRMDPQEILIFGRGWIPRESLLDESLGISRESILDGSLGPHYSLFYSHW